MASSDPEFDRFVKGMIQAYREVLAIEPEIELEDIEEAAENEI